MWLILYLVFKTFQAIGLTIFSDCDTFCWIFYFFFAKNVGIRSLCYRTNFLIPVPMYFYLVILCIWHKHWNSLLLVLWYFVHAPCHCDVFCIFWNLYKYRLLNINVYFLYFLGSLHTLPQWWCQIHQGSRRSPQPRGCIWLKQWC